MSSSDRPILTWKGAQLFLSDVAILKSDSAWLNDRILTFWFEHLRVAHEQLFTTSPPDGEPPPSTHEKTGTLTPPRQNQCFPVFVGAESAFWLRNEVDFEDVSDTIRALLFEDAARREWIRAFLPVNNNSDPAKIGGSHWSLLVWDVIVAPAAAAPQGHPVSGSGPAGVDLSGCRSSFLHLDSSASQINAEIAREFATKLERCISGRPQIVLIGEASGSSVERNSESKFSLSLPPIAPLDGGDHVESCFRMVPQQQNGHDCGLYAAAFATCLAGATTEMEQGLWESMVGSDARWIQTGGASSGKIDFGRRMRNTILRTVERAIGDKNSYRS